MTAWEDHATEQTFKSVIEMIVQMYELRANLNPSALRKSQLQGARFRSRHRGTYQVLTLSQTPSHLPHSICNISGTELCFTGYADTDATLPR